MKAPIKLLALDIDGTIVNKSYELADTVAESIKKVCRTTDIIVMLASGRMLQATIPLAQMLELTTPVVVYQGAMVYDFSQKEIIFHQPVPPDLALDVVNDLESYGVHVNLYINGDLCMKEVPDIAKEYSSYRYVTPRVIDSYTIVTKNPPTKILGLERDTDKVQEIIKALSAKYGAELNVFGSNPTFIEVVNNQVNKGKTLMEVAKKFWNIDPENIMAIGDADNDYDMIKLAGYGIAMGNATPKTQSVADFITKSVDEHGVKHALEEFILNT